MLLKWLKVLLNKLFFFVFFILSWVVSVGIKERVMKDEIIIVLVNMFLNFLNKSFVVEGRNVMGINIEVSIVVVVIIVKNIFCVFIMVVVWVFRFIFLWCCIFLEIIIVLFIIIFVVNIRVRRVRILMEKFMF